ncbi:unnamed protein product [Dicrocoelium dendriticum]|nr:unnamed protein product [Dicrocoelium dendriticum]
MMIKPSVPKIVQRNKSSCGMRSHKCDEIKLHMGCDLTIPSSLKSAENGMHRSLSCVSLQQNGQANVPVFQIAWCVLDFVPEFWVIVYCRSSASWPWQCILDLCPCGMSPLNPYTPVSNDLC